MVYCSSFTDSGRHIVCQMRLLNVRLVRTTASRYAEFEQAVQ